MVCCVQVTQLVEFLIEHHEELFGEEVAGLAGTSDESPLAPGLAAAAAEVCQGHKQLDDQSLPPQKGECCRRGDKQDHPPTCSSARAQSKAEAGWPLHFGGDAARTGSAGLCKPIRGICLSELR